MKHPSKGLESTFGISKAQTLSNQIYQLKAPCLNSNWQIKKRVHAFSAWTLFSQPTCNEFQKSIYPSFLRNKAQNNTLSLDDIFDNYRDSFELKVYVFGNDALTGARKLFISPTYTLDNIKTGKYITPVSLNAKKYRHCRYKKYVEDNLAFLEDVNGVY